MAHVLSHGVHELLSSPNALRDQRISKRLILSYIVDWVVILFTAALGRIIKIVEPNRNPFSLKDQSISYPFAVNETISVTVLIIVSLVVPAVVIAALSLLFTPHSSDRKSLSKTGVWRRKIWEWNVGWMGLGVSYAATWTATEGLKLVFGKPRPDLLSRCNPDLSDISRHIVGGLGEVLEGAPSLVAWTICQNKSDRLSRDGFVSFPSGHASMSFAGLAYLSLWLAAKLCVAFPYLPRRWFARPVHQDYLLNPARLSDADGDNQSGDDGNSSFRRLQPIRNQGAAPPTYLLFLVMIPICAATYIASSRWVDNRHYGFDILFGSLLGTTFAWIGFRLYNPPLNSGAVSAWGCRTWDHAFSFRHEVVPDTTAKGGLAATEDALPQTRSSI
ncbi:hypothetical protein FQN57_000437 [Myotisia sp. PD_48]|nr:hypothetical protein FQN57_000437 [Myotisia sp. PD_48]